MSWLGYILLLFALSWAGVGLFRWYAIQKGMLDKPNQRSSHTVPTPRGGGIIFFAGWIILLVVLYYFHMIKLSMVWLFLPVIPIGLIGFWDDQKNLSASLRFIVQLLSAVGGLFLLEEGGGLLQTWFPALPLPVCFIVLLLAIVWMTNLFNFMDGSDGIAAMEAIFVFGVGGLFLYQIHAYELVLLAWGLVALLAGFLTWNWPVAQIFMGDSGSGFLGFLIALLALVSYKLFQMPLLLWAILTGMFWFDATLTLLRRLLAGEEWRKPHRSHAYQRLIQSGWSHQKVLIGSMVVNTVLSGLAWMAFCDPRLLTFSFGVTIAFLAIVYLLVEIHKPMFRSWHEA